MQILRIKLRAVLTIEMADSRVRVRILLLGIHLPLLLNTQFKVIKSAFVYINSIFLICSLSIFKSF